MLKSTPTYTWGDPQRLSFSVFLLQVIKESLSNHLLAINLMSYHTWQRIQTLKSCWENSLNNTTESKTGNSVGGAGSDFLSHYIKIVKTSNFNKKLRGIKTDPTKIDTPFTRERRNEQMQSLRKQRYCIYQKPLQSQGAKENNGQRN